MSSNRRTLTPMKLRLAFRLRNKKSQQSKTIALRDDWLQPVPTPEDVLLRNEKSCRPLVNNGKESLSTSSNRPSFTEDQNIAPCKVFISDGLEPGQKVRVRLPCGAKMQTVVPDKSTWKFKNCSGRPRPYFIVSVHPSDRKLIRSKEHSSQSRKKVQFAEPTRLASACQCIPSLGVYDSICPIHGIAL